MPTTTSNYGLYKPVVNDPTDEDVWGDLLNDNMDTIDNAIFNSVPAGAVIDFAGASAPSGWLLCYGQAVSRTTFAALFTAIGTTYGTGDGSTTFNVPDARGRVIAGQDDMGGTSADRLTGLSGGIDGDTLGAVGGSQSHTLSTTEIPAHSHGVTDPGHAHQQRRDDNLGGGGGGTPDANYGNLEYGLTSSSTTGISIQNTGGGGAHNNVQPTLILNKIIKT